MSKRGDRRRKRQKKRSKHWLDVSGPELEYCSNLDDYEYGCLWECYELESPTFISRNIIKLYNIYDRLRRWLYTRTLVLTRKRVN